MAGAFAITTTTTSAKLPSTRRGQFQFTVTNISGRQLTARGKVTPQTPEQNAWFTIEGQPERSCAPNATLNYAVDVAIPLTAPATPITFHLDAIGVENPDEYNSQGPAIVLEVPPAEQPKAPFPWWIVAVAAVAVLVLGGGTFLAYHFISGTNKQAAQASPSPKADPRDRFVATWVLSQTDPTSLTIATARQGTSMTSTVSYQCAGSPPPGPCQFPATATYDPQGDTVTFAWSEPISKISYVAIAGLNQPGDTMTLVVNYADGSNVGTVTMTRKSCGPKCIVGRPTLKVIRPT
jgi:hypothetical protein